MTTQEKIAVMQAFVDGQEIQFSAGYSNNWVDTSGVPGWNWADNNYRVKPKPVFTMSPNWVRVASSKFWRRLGRGEVLMADGFFPATQLVILANIFVGLDSLEWSDDAENWSDPVLDDEIKE